MTYILWNNCHLTLNYVILLYMDVNRMRKNTEKRMKAYSIRYKMSKELRITMVGDKRFSMKGDNHLNLSLRRKKKLKKS